jgi:hypothetical protein
MESKLNKLNSQTNLILKGNTKKISESILVNLPNPWPKTWDRDNFMERKVKKKKYQSSTNSMLKNKIKK